MVFSHVLLKNFNPCRISFREPPSNGPEQNARRQCRVDLRNEAEASAQNDQHECRLRHTGIELGPVQRAVKRAAAPHGLLAVVCDTGIGVRDHWSDPGTEALQHSEDDHD